MIDQLTELLLPVLAVGLLCAAWVVVQTWIRRHEPTLHGPEGGTHCGSRSCDGNGACGGNPEDCPNGSH